MVLQGPPRILSVSRGRHRVDQLAPPHGQGRRRGRRSHDNSETGQVIASLGADGRTGHVQQMARRYVHPCSSLRRVQCSDEDCFFFFSELRVFKDAGASPACDAQHARGAPVRGERVAAQANTRWSLQCNNATPTNMNRSIGQQPDSAPIPLLAPSSC